MSDSSYSRSSGRKRSNDDNDPKKQKNREAARKCREKKVKETEDLKKKNEELMRHNKELDEKKNDLEQKLMDCINEIKRHKTSGCSLPPHVAAIIESPDNCLKLIREGRLLSTSDSSIVESIGTDNCQDDSDSDVPAEEIQPTILVKGLFNGEQLSANSVQKIRVRNPSSRSSSRSPPAPYKFVNRNHMIGTSSSTISSASSSSSSSSSSSPSSSKNPNVGSKLMLQPTWHQLHQLNDQASPGLSPAQTVPNIDTDWQNVPDIYSKQNRFPDIEEAVRHAQRDPGVVDDAGYSHFHHQHHNIANENSSEISSTTSFGFTPQVSTPSCSSISSTEFHYINSLEHKGIQNSLRVNSNFHESLKPSTSNSMTVSMNHTAELLSQAITNNFDDSEISEDLKKQYAQLAKNQEKKMQGVQENQSHDVQNEQFTQDKNDGAVEQDQVNNETQMQNQGGNNISFDALLQLAKNQQTITVQYQGREYTCNYEQVEQLITYISSQQTDVQMSESNTNVQTADYYPESPATQMVMANNLQNQTIDNSSILQNNTYNSQTDFTTIHGVNVNHCHDGIVPTCTQASAIETPVHSTELPTTVLSMIQNDLQESQNQPTVGSFPETYVDNVDYSENVKDLPSLSLTEDHTNIFEKKRRTH